MVDFTTPLQDAAAVSDLFQQAATAARECTCRTGAADHIGPPGRLLATGDIHDNPVHLARVLKLAQLEDSPGNHVTFHEVIHGDNLLNDMDFSYRMLARIAELKLRFPGQVHVLLGNHELSQIVGVGVVKHGINCKDAFNDALDYVFNEKAEEVADAVESFIRSMALALITENGILCAHSLPNNRDMDIFDPEVLHRTLRDEDYVPGRGSAHRMVWGRKHEREQLETLATTWGVRIFILGHQLAETGFEVRPPNVLILNSDHPRGCVLPIDLEEEVSLEDLQLRTVPLAAVQT